MAWLASSATRAQMNKTFALRDKYVTTMSVVFLRKRKSAGTNPECI